MSSSPNNSTSSDSSSPQIAGSRTPPALTSVSLNERPLPKGNNSMASDSISVDSQGPSLSPADCRTLQKILHDVRSTSPPSQAPYFSDTSPTRLNFTAAPNCKTDENKMDYEDMQLDRGNEQQDGYEDEDDSMELTDGEDAFGGAIPTDGDTIEDVMNLPGDIAPPVPIQDYGRFYTHDTPTPDGAEELQLRRASIERDLDEQCRQQERVHTAAVEDGVCDLDLPIDGVSNHSLAVEENGDLRTLQEDSEMHQIEEQRAASDGFKASEASSHQPRASILSSSVRRASEATPMASTSFIVFQPSTCAVVQTPNGKHIDFATSTPTPDATMSNASGYFESQQDKKSSPSKRRRNASSPEDIAELARNARIEEEEAAEQRELAELDQFREMDLAPIETVMEGGSAGDLIMCGTPVKARDEDLFLQRGLGTSDLGIEDRKYVQPPHSASSSPLRHSPLIEQDEENDADVETSDTASTLKQQKPTFPARHPTFVTVIGMLPAAMFWATAAPIAKCSNKAFDTLIEKLTGLKV